MSKVPSLTPIHFGRGGRERSRDPVRHQLSAREFEVLQLLAEGRRNKEIATELGVSVSTVNKHVSHVIVKMQAATRTDAVVRALREGLTA